MINQMNPDDHTPNAFSNVFKELQIGKPMRKSNIKKSCGVSAYEVFQFLLLLVFQGKNLFRFLNSKPNGFVCRAHFNFVNRYHFRDKK